MVGAEYIDGREDPVFSRDILVHPRLVQRRTVKMRAAEISYCHTVGHLRALRKRKTIASILSRRTE